MQGVGRMDKMRKEMWERAKDRLRQEAPNYAIDRDLCMLILRMNLIEERNLIFGSLNTRKVKE